MTDNIFDSCVDILSWMGSVTGLSYKAVNVWIFCVLLPLLMLAWGVWTLVLLRRLRDTRFEVRFSNYLVLLLVKRVREVAVGKTLHPALLEAVAAEAEKHLAESAQVLGNLNWNEDEVARYQKLTSYPETCYVDVFAGYPIPLDHGFKLVPYEHVSMDRTYNPHKVCTSPVRSWAIIGTDDMALPDRGGEGVLHVYNLVEAVREMDRRHRIT